MANVRLQDRRAFLRGGPFVWCWASLALCLGILWCETKAWAKSDYEIINTGIKGGGCWYDDTHFVVVKGQQPAPGQEFEVEGLYYLDPAKSKDLKRIDLSPIESSLQLYIRDVTCQAQHILFKLRSNETGLWRLYSLVIGSEPELIAEMRGGGGANLIGHYVAGKFRRSSAVEAQGMTGIGIYEAAVDCGIKYVKPGFKGLCVDTWMESGWGLPSLRFVKYIWYETIKVKNKYGQVAWVPNPEPPLKRTDGTDVKLGFFLRDLENHIVQEIETKQDDYQVYSTTFKLDPRGRYLYAACSKSGDHGEHGYTMGGRICRFLLDGKTQKWEEVFALQVAASDLFDLQYLDIDEVGDVVMIDHGHQGAIGLWKYTAVTRSIERLAVGPIRDAPSTPQLSPSGSRVSFSREGLLHFAVRKGVAQ